MKNFYKKYTYPYLESICLQLGSLQNIHFHEDRIYKTISKRYELKNIINTKKKEEGVWKVRFLYGTKGFDYTILPYKAKKILSLKIAHDNVIKYNVKYSDRTVFKQLKNKYNIVDKEDVIIVQNGLVTDSSYSNLVFFDGEKYTTPKRPLLEGVKRKCLLEKKKILVKDIKLEEISLYMEVHLINAMLDIGDCVVDIKNVKA